MPGFFSIMEEIIEKCQQTLEGNWRDGFTVPSKKLYPFQWNWDSGIVAVGMSHHNLDYSIKEIETLFSGQWENGMVPHILFHSEKESTYFPNFDFWNSNVNPGAPKFPKSSGITQPAVHGFVLERLLESHPGNSTLIQFAKSIFPKIYKYHRYLYEHRDPEKEGLIFMYHPWESGRDNSPLWDKSLQRIKVSPGDLPAYQRRDTEIADPSERPTTFEYDRYVFLLEMGKRNMYEGSGIFDESPFKIQDTLMNAILIKSNQSLINVGDTLGFDTTEIKEWQSQSAKAFGKLWNNEISAFAPYDLIDNQHIPHKEIGGLVSLLAGMASKEQASIMNDYLQSLHKRNYYLCPSFDVDSELFDSKRYWRGPIWPQMNWLIYQGLKAYDFYDTAEIVKSDILELTKQHGLYEYFEAQKDLAAQLEVGYGGNHFSWTSSCVIDLIKSK